VQRRAIAQEADAEVLDQVEIGLPPFVEAAGLVLIDPRLAVVDGGIGILDAGREHEHRC
jgi:hypothetical protein